MAKPARYTRHRIPEGGVMLTPHRLYLARTVERTETRNLVPMLEGRSSVGRLGLFIHVTAGFGDVGFCGFWTLEMFCVQPVRIYAGVEIGQIFYHTLEGAVAGLRRRPRPPAASTSTTATSSRACCTASSKPTRRGGLFDGPPTTPAQTPADL